jgi:hypothetical protein
VAYTVKPLDEATWPAFAKLVENNNGVFGGCWCMGFHADDSPNAAGLNRERKLARVRARTAHAALVFDGDDCLGWAQFGSPADVVKIKNRAAYEKSMTSLPDWRIGCCFVGKGRAVTAFPLPRSWERSTSSRVSAAARSRDIPRMRARCPRASSTWALSRRSRSSDSSATA